jgi:hypothetical protein
MDAALLGQKDARDAVLDRLEGKAIRGQAVQAPDNTLDEQLDRASIDAINRLAAPTPKE